MIALHVVEKHSAEDLASAFHLCVRHTKLILRSHKDLLMPSHEETMTKVRAMAKHRRVRQLITERVDSRQGLISKPRLAKEIREKLGVEIKTYALTKLIRRELQLVWRRVRPQHAYVNSHKNIVLRQTFAIKLIDAIKAGKKIINMDETCITSTFKNAYSYGCRGEGNSRTFNKSVQGLSLLLAISQDGLRVFQFINGTHNTWTFMAFMTKLVALLDLHLENWREQYVILIDNCPAHSSAITAKMLSHMGVPIMFSAPASYAALPVEGVFKIVKARDLDAMPDPSVEELREGHVERVTFMHRVMYKLAINLMAMPDSRIVRQFCSQLPALQLYI